MLVLSRKLNEKIVIDGGYRGDGREDRPQSDPVGNRSALACSRVPRRDRRHHAASRRERSGRGGRLKTDHRGSAVDEWPTC